MTIQEGPLLLPHVYLAACMNRSAASVPSNTCRQAGAEALTAAVSAQAVTAAGTRHPGSGAGYELGT